VSLDHLLSKEQEHIKLCIQASVTKSSPSLYSYMYLSTFLHLAEIFGSVAQLVRALL
jgi:hypothetical protein